MNCKHCGADGAHAGTRECQDGDRCLLRCAHQERSELQRMGQLVESVQADLERDDREAWRQCDEMRGERDAARLRIVAAVDALSQLVASGRLAIHPRCVRLLEQDGESMTPAESHSVDQLRLARRALRAAETHLLQAGNTLPAGSIFLAQDLLRDLYRLAERSNAVLVRSALLLTGVEGHARGTAW